MVPPAGRPPKSGEEVSVLKHYRLTKKTIAKIEKCAIVLKLNNTQVVENAVDLLYSTLTAKEKD
jgi:hypothetical protein